MMDVGHPLIMLTAIVTGAVLLRRSQQTVDLTKNQKMAIGGSAFVGAMVGAKLPFAMDDWERFLEGSAWFSDGKTILCGMVGAYFAVELAKWTLSIRTKTGDSFAVPVAFTVAIGRLGCLYSGCCFGLPSDVPWAFSCSAMDRLARHPTQLYESLFHFSMGCILIWMSQCGLWKGQQVKFYILSYLVFRFVTEWLRPEDEWWIGFTAYQWFAFAMIPVFGILWWKDHLATTIIRGSEINSP